MRTVTGTIKKMDGSAWVSGAVVWNLIEVFTTATETYLPTSYTANTDSNGTFSLSVAVPSSGTAYYQFTLPDGRMYDAYLGAGAAIDISTIIITTQTSVAANDLQALLAASAIIVAQTVTTTYAMTGSEMYLRCNGTFTVTLPPATGSGLAYTIKNVGLGTITVDGNGSETIDGQLTRTLNNLEKVSVFDAAAGAWDVI